MKEPTFEQIEARQFFLDPCKTTLLRVADLALVAFDPWTQRWEEAAEALGKIGLAYTDEELDKALTQRQNERAAS